MTTTIEVTETPDITALYGRVVTGLLPLGGGGDAGDGGLPDVVVHQPGVHVDVDHLAAYAEVCGFRLGDVLPPTYLHMLGFPLSVEIMTRSDFPFGLLGMVHVGNRITQHRPVTLDETVDLTASVTNLRPHPKGRQMDNVVEARVDGEVVWESLSTYLKRGSSDEDVAEEPRAADDVRVADLPFTGLVDVPGDIGRRYGSVSGDRNPIHLTALSAKAFGFPRAIAHGMWTKARALAALEGEIPAACEIDVAFKLPLTIPREVELATERRGDGIAVGVRSRDGKPHLAGMVTRR